MKIEKYILYFCIITCIWCILAASFIDPGVYGKDLFLFKLLFIVLPLIGLLASSYALHKFYKV